MAKSTGRRLNKHARDFFKAQREREGSARLKTEREFTGPIMDFVSGFYLLRAGRVASPTCSVVFGSHRAFTVLLEPLGVEAVETPIGQRPAEKLRSALWRRAFAEDA